MQVTKLWEDLDTDMKMMRLQWWYRPHDTAQGRVPDQVENSVCLSNHADDNPLDTPTCTRANTHIRSQFGTGTGKPCTTQCL